MTTATRERTPSAPPFAAFRGWDVRDHRGRVIDTVFYMPTASAEEVQNQLINHDGYAVDITVERA